MSGCRLLTDHAFFPLLDALDDNLMKITLETLNVSGLDLLSASLIHQLLNKISSLQELCLGVTYDLDEADQILQVINSDGNEIRFYINVEKFYTICRLSSNESSSADNKERSINYQQLQLQQEQGQEQVEGEEEIENQTTLPSSSTWNIPPSVFPL